VLLVEKKKLIKPAAPTNATQFFNDNDDWVETGSTKLKGGRKRKGGYKSSRFAKYRRTVNSPKAGSR
jgi:hypothetical protein